VTGPTAPDDSLRKLRELHVSGGAGGTYARYEDLYTLARDSDDLAGALALTTAQCHAMLADPNVLASAVLDPVGAARFEQTLLSALDGRHGLPRWPDGWRSGRSGCGRWPRRTRRPTRPVRSRSTSCAGGPETWPAR
jgi:hypothetical protein